MFGGGGPPFLAALVSKIGVQAIPTGVPTLLDWQNPVYDYGDWFGAPGDAFLTVPAGVARVRVSASVSWGGVLGTLQTVEFLKNGASAIGLPLSISIPPLSVSPPIVSSIIEVAPGNTLSLRVQHDSGVAEDVTAAATTYLGVEAAR
jgi:hypothetical protein